ncbi:MBL fold metallo-hydrolase [Arcanobacterium hippocoleae]
MIILRYSKTFLDANCYILADSVYRQALVVDPGAGSRFWVKETLAKHNLTLGAVLLTHGHADHIWDVSAFSGNVPVYVPQPDLYRLDDPLGTLGLPNFALAFTRMGISQWEKPKNLQSVPDFAYETGFEFVPGITLRAVSAPGHTEGSSVFLFDGNIDNLAAVPEAFLQSDLVPGRQEHFMLSGDIIFKNGIGRTDLPGETSKRWFHRCVFL